MLGEFVLKAEGEFEVGMGKPGISEAGRARQSYYFLCPVLKCTTEKAIKKYQNKILTAAEVIEELILISKEIVASDAEAQNMGLSDYEYAFYTAVASNDSARELMQQDTLRELAVVLTQKIRENATIDWTIKESVRAKLKVIVKRILRQYGYPPDMQLLATETVLKQAEMIASDLAG